MKTSLSIIENKEKLGIRLITAILFFVILLTNTALFSQQALDIKSAITSLDKSANSADKIKANHLKSLAYDFHPTFFFKNTKVITHSEEKPIVGEIEYSQISSLYFKNSLFENVEFLRIMVSSPNQTGEQLNLSLLSHFKSLKYVQFVCSFKCSQSFINSLFIPDSGVSVMYSQEIPE